jgi:assimilatory nitrate reductase catalytic subunit
MPREGAIEYHDTRRGTFRSGFVDAHGRLTDCLFVGRPELQGDATWLVPLLAGEGPLTDADRRALLSGRVPSHAVSEGRVVCSCFQVGIERIRAAIRRDGIADTASLGRRLQCGTNCGSCLPELREIIAHERRLAAE